MSDKTIYPRERDLYRERDELRAELDTVRGALATEMRFHDEARAENERLRAALALVMPVCRDCGDPLGIDDLDIEQPGEDGVWVHQTCQT